jgi:type I restriction enzyme M protein
VAESDGFGRFRYGIPPKTKGDFAFVEHMIATLNQNGRMGVVVPHGVLFRGGAEGEIRKNIAKEDIIEAVVGLPPNLFYGTGIPAAILIINKNKPPERRGSILFIDASQDFLEGKKQNYLRDQDIEKIVGAYKGYMDVPKYCCAVPLSEIEENDYNLNISRYVDTAPEEEPIDVAGTLQELRALEARRREVEAQMNEYLKELGYGA